MPKILYFTAVNMVDGALDGVGKKISAQCAVFGDKFGRENVFISSFVDGGYAVRLWNSGSLHFLALGASSIRKIQLKNIYRGLLDFVCDNEIDSVYFRCPGLDFNSHLFFRKLSELGVSIIIEIPTWPFWPEKKDQIKASFADSFTAGVLKSGGALCYWIETHRLYGLVDSVVSFGNVDKIWGLNTYALSNGYDFNAVAPLKDSFCGKGIRFVTAATLRRNHGIDRLINAVANYRGTVPVSFHIAGEGEASEELKSLAGNLGVLGSTVHFYGYLHGDDLINLYQSCDVGVSALGFHRYGVYDCSPLKTKEYLALGLPCLGTDSEKDILASRASAFYYPVASDESPIPLEEVVNYFFSIYQAGCTHRDVRDAAMESFDWATVMRPVCERFEKLASGKAVGNGC